MLVGGIRLANPLAAQAPDSLITVRGVVIVPQDGIPTGGATTLALILPTFVEGRPVLLFELAGDRGRWERYQERYLEVVGTVALPARDAGAGSGRPRFTVQRLREVPDEHSVRRTVSPSTTQNLVLTLTVVPSRVEWRTSDGDPTHVSPTVFFRVANHSQVPLELHFPTNQFACFSVTEEATGQVWERIEGARPEVARLRIDLGSTFRRVMAVPLEAARAPGRYTVRAGFCGMGDYQIEAPFEVVR